MYNILYTSVVDDIFSIFTSRARVLVLRTLYFQPQPAPLRHIAHMANLPIFSVQNAVKSLLDDKVIRRATKNNQMLFGLNNNNPLYRVMEQFFIIEMSNRISTEAKTYDDKAKMVLEFASAADIIFRKVKQEGNLR